MDFFLPCWIALSTIFTEAPSKSYFHKVSKTFASRMQVCSTIAKEASKEGVDPILAISIAATESGFLNNLTSSKGAKGPLGVIPKYHCPKKGKCDYIKAGIRAIQKVSDVRPDDLCSALAVYNRGLEEGRCEEGRSEYYYAMVVMDTYDKICSATDLCKRC